MGSAYINQMLPIRIKSEKNVRMCALGTFFERELEHIQVLRPLFLPRP